MKRLVILVLYSLDSEIEEFKKRLITDIQPYAETLQVVCNGKVSKTADELLKITAPMF